MEIDKESVVDNTSPDVKSIRILDTPEEYCSLKAFGYHTKECEHKDITENTPLDELTATTDGALINKINEIIRHLNR